MRSFAQSMVNHCLLTTPPCTRRYGSRDVYSYSYALALLESRIVYICGWVFGLAGPLTFFVTCLGIALGGREGEGWKERGTEMRSQVNAIVECPLLPPPRCFLPPG